MDLAFAIIGICLMFFYWSILPIWHDRKKCKKELLLGLFGILFAVIAVAMNLFLPYRAMNITVRQYDSSRDFNYLQTHITFAETTYVAEIAVRKPLCWVTEKHLILMDTNSQRLLDKVAQTLSENKYLSDIKVGELKIESDIVKEK